MRDIVFRCISYVEVSLSENEARRTFLPNRGTGLVNTSGSPTTGSVSHCDYTGISVFDLLKSPPTDVSTTL